MTRTATGHAARAIDELPTLWDGFATLVGAGLDMTAFGAETAEDMNAGAQAFSAMDPAEAPGSRASVDMCGLKLERELT